jgi:hypothetical protein
MQSHRIVLPFEGDLLGSEIFASTNAGLVPRLLTWYGEPAGPSSSVFLMGSGFNVRDMKVIVGGQTLKEPGTAASPGADPPATYDLISRNVLRIDIPKTAKANRTPVVYRDPSFVCYDHGMGKNEVGECKSCVDLKAAAKAADEAAKSAAVAAKEADAKAKKDLADRAAAAAKASPADQKLAEEARAAHSASLAADAALAEAKSALAKAKVPAAPQECACKQRWVIDVHVATSNGISNHLFIEVAEPAPTAETKPLSTLVITTTKTNPADASTTTSTEFRTTPPGIILPPGTYLPMGGNLPAAGTVVAPGAATLNGQPSTLMPGTVPSTWYPPLTAPKPATGHDGPSASAVAPPGGAVGQAGNGPSVASAASPVQSDAVAPIETALGVASPATPGLANPHGPAANLLPQSTSALLRGMPVSPRPAPGVAYDAHVPIDPDVARASAQQPLQTPSSAPASEPRPRPRTSILSRLLGRGR